MVSLRKDQEFCSSIDIFHFWNFQLRYLEFKFSLSPNYQIIKIKNNLDLCESLLAASMFLFFPPDEFHD